MYCTYEENPVLYTQIQGLNMNEVCRNMTKYVCMYGLQRVFCSLAGTSHNGGYSHEAVVYALQHCGYRHIDTAKRYGCETYIAQAVKVINGRLMIVKHTISIC